MHLQHTHIHIHTPLFGKGRVMQSNNNKEGTFQLCSQKELNQVPVFTYAAVAAEVGKYWWYSICIAFGRDTPVISKNQYCLGIKYVPGILVSSLHLLSHLIFIVPYCMGVTVILFVHDELKWDLEIISNFPSSTQWEDK